MSAARWQSMPADLRDIVLTELDRESEFEDVTNAYQVARSLLWELWETSMIGTRMSGLELSQYCGRAGSLNSASGRPAVMGSYFHAKMANQPDLIEWANRLTSDELEEVTEWHQPGDLVVKGWGTYCYRDARTEIVVALNGDGSFCKEGAPDCITVGHIDACWISERIDGSKLAVVSDIKKSKYTVDGPMTLQNVAYGLAWAAKNNCTHMVLDIWAATEGEHVTSPVIDLFEEGGDLWERVKHAAMNVDPENPVMGNHCKSCYGWQRCDAYTIKASGADGMADEEEISAGNAEALLMLADAHIRFGELTKKRLQLYAEHTPITSEDGFKRWGKTMQKGRESVMGVKKLREKLGDEEANKLITKGVEFPRYTWTNTEAGKDNAKKVASLKAKEKRDAKKAEKEKV